MEFNTLIIVFFALGIMELGLGIFLSDERVLKQFKKDGQYIDEEKKFIKYQRFLFILSGIVVLLIAVLIKFSVIPENYIIAIYIAYFVIEIGLNLYIKKKFFKS